MAAPVLATPHLILGGSRSGKSRYACHLAEASALPVHFIATAQAHDAEMAARIRQHQAERPPHWQLHEEPLALAERLRSLLDPQRVVLVDCLTLWLTNLLLDPQADRLQEERQALLEVVRACHTPLLLVSNETGLGVTPLGELTRRFVDENGRMNQELAQICPQVSWVVAGLPQRLKGA
ncbi:MAG: bifunctional adenosylcobinamide kinase/adenosylcobinamide-phosphate guanylyltransferase [Magnetococcales bacterium]|nr:bifunctional adenosylcobinamide kinase/adenosylcobinamide-phosphate guanylyltransferase [Magnetococcales bacterium]